jgi:hypothetical protein
MLVDRLKRYGDDLSREKMVRWVARASSPGLPFYPGRRKHGPLSQLLPIEKGQPVAPSASPRERLAAGLARPVEAFRLGVP